MGHGPPRLGHGTNENSGHLTPGDGATRHKQSRLAHVKVVHEHPGGPQITPPQPKAAGQKQHDAGGDYETDTLEASVEVQLYSTNGKGRNDK